MDEVLYDLCDWGAIEGIVYADYRDVHGILGPHVTKEGIMVSAYYPNAASVSVRLNATGKEYEMELVDELGFWSVLLPGKRILKYSFVVLDKEGNITKEIDKYAVKSNFTEEDLVKFESGIHYDVYKKMGAHLSRQNGVEGAYFAVWAPNAFRVSVVGSFNNWDGRVDQMGEIGNSGIFEIFVPGVRPGDLYKFEMKVKGGIILKADPYGFKSELMPQDASVVYDLDNYTWSDEEWIKVRKSINKDEMPLSIYELHLGSFRSDIVNPNYRDMAPIVAEYVLDMGYTHIELMPITEYKDESLDGYKVTGYYAPTSRYGTPDDFMYFIEYMHSKNIGVILDWVPAYFAADDIGLAKFDGTCLYEHLDTRQGIHPHLGTHIFNYAREQVSNFLLANAFFWFDVYHIDGLRVNDGASMLYLDFGREPGAWVPNMYGENENLDAVEFFKHLNSIHEKRCDGTMIIAEETTSWMSITEPVEEDGLGFDYKWNTDWVNDVTEYLHLDPLYRKGKHDQITLSMLYNYSNKYMLELSHDVVNRYEGSIMTSFKDEFTQNHSTMKVLLAYMMMHPGKKLVFMGQDFAYTKKWNANTPIDWTLLGKESYRQVNDLMRDLNTLYRDSVALHKYDFVNDGFEWINEMDADRSIISFIRKTDESKDTLLVICNFTPVAYEDYKIGVPYKGRYKEIFSTEDTKYGGIGIANPRIKNARPGSADGRDYYMNVIVEPLSVAVYKYVPLESAKVQEQESDINIEKSKEKKSPVDTIAKTASKASKAITTKAEAVSKTVSDKAEVVSKTVSTKAEKVSKSVSAKAEEVLKKAEEAKELVSETVTIAADEIKKSKSRGKKKK